MTTELLFLAKNRLRFTQESLSTLRRNTDWSRIDKTVIYDDGSTDGTLEYLQGQAAEMGAELRQTRLGSAVAVGSHFIKASQADILIKIDNDAMYPPGWLDASLGVMQRRPELQMLCLEDRGLDGPMPYSYKSSVQVGGLFVIRRNVFNGNDVPIVLNKYWGLQIWVNSHKLTRGWILPSLPVFLLDRVPFEPWMSLNAEYEKQGWQRPTVGAIHMYTMAQKNLWSWCDWPDPQIKTYRALKPFKFRGVSITPGDVIPTEWGAETIKVLVDRKHAHAWDEPMAVGA